MSVEAGQRYRKLPPVMSKITLFMEVMLVLIGALYVLGVYLYLGVAFSSQQFLGLMLAISLAIIFLSVPPKGSSSDKLPWYDYLLAALGVICGLYVLVWYPKIASTLFFASPDKYVLSTIAILLIFEATRRLYGPVLVLITAGFIFYASFANFFPGILKTTSIPWTDLSTNLYLGNNGAFGYPMEVIATIVLAFIVFGALMFAGGGGSLFTDIATAALGRFRGGPAKVAVLGSCFFGSISGAALANVAVTGTFTIPLMKKLGYRPETAAAVEATASVGGIVTPPIMGSVAFIMADFLQIPYYKIVIAAVIPALLYYEAILIQVDLEAARHKMKGLPADQIPSLGGILRPNWPFLIPLAVIVFTLMILYWEPAKSGMAACIVTAVIILFRVKGQSLRWWLDLLGRAGRSSAEIILIGALVGLIVGATDITGLGFSISMIMMKVGQTNILLLLFVTAISSIVLGMGIPGIAIYIMQVALIVPALIKLHIAPIAAHFFIIYFGCFSMITPPVCLAVMAAASIAGSDIWKSGWEAVKLGIVAFIVPFLFVLSPTLIFQGNIGHILINLTTAALGVVAMAVGLRGFFLLPVRAFNRALLILAALGLMMPTRIFPFALTMNMVCLVLTAGILFGNYRSSVGRSILDASPK